MSCGQKQNCGLAPIAAPCASYVEAPQCYQPCYQQCAPQCAPQCAQPYTQANWGGYQQCSPCGYNSGAGCGLICGLEWYQWLLFIIVLFFVILLVILLLKYGQFVFGAGAGAGVYQRPVYAQQQQYGAGAADAYAYARN